MSNDNVYERLFKLWAMVCKLLLDGKRDPAKVADLLQEIVSEPQPKPEPKPEPVIDPMVQVDLTYVLTYPDWVEKPLHPELERMSPGSFDSSKLIEWLHDDQETGRVNGDALYEYMLKENMLKDCLGFRELQAIQAKGTEHFRKFWKGKAVFGWRSVVLCRGGGRHVPCLVEGGVKVVLGWGRLDFDWHASHPALRFAS